jgi:uncharacterized delta-60 repeat protein
VSHTSTSDAIVVFRYSASGELDSTFGTEGETEITLPDPHSSANGIVIQSDRKLVIATAGALVTSDGAAFTVIRLNTDGSLDTTFGENGMAEDDLSLTTFGVPTGIALLADEIVVAGEVTGSNSSQEAVVLRLLPDGSLDDTFGQSGVVVASFGANTASVTSPVIQANGQIVLGGTISGNTTTVAGSLALLRLNADGSLDTSFGVRGYAITPVATTPVFSPIGASAFEAESVALQSDGSILILAQEFVSNAGINYPFAAVLARYNRGGTLDPTFGTDGLVTTIQGTSSGDTGLVVQSDGNIVVSGFLSAGLASSVALTRFFGTPLANVSNNQLFVEQVYGQLLNRPADSGGLLYFTTLLNDRISRVAIVGAIEQSTEYRTDEIDQLYETLLGRASDSGGLDNFLTALASGASITDVEAAILGSGEFYNRSGGTTDGFLTALFADVLNRSVDPAGQQSFSTLISQGMSTQGVATIVLDSPEARVDVVDAFYNTYLQRPADAAGLAAFASPLPGGSSNEAIIAAILGSDEYFERFVD